MAIINGNANDNPNLFGTQNNDTIRGFGGNDSLYGFDGNDLMYGDTPPGVWLFPTGVPGNDELFGGDGNDVLHGQAGNDELYGGTGNDDLYGEVGNDQLLGDSGNDRLYGGIGKDSLYGGVGNDVLIGVESSDSTPGQGEIDILTGGSGNDKFFLGRIGTSFYDDGVINANNQGLGDYALITDFTKGQDQIQLTGGEGYILQDITINTPLGLVVGTGIYLNQGTFQELDGDFFLAKELIGVVQGVDPGDLTINNGSPLTFIV